MLYVSPSRHHQHVSRSLKKPTNPNKYKVCWLFCVLSGLNTGQLLLTYIGGMIGGIPPISGGIDQKGSVAMPLTDILLRNAKPKEKAYKLADSGGLYIEIATSGSKLWRLKYRYAGKEKRLSFGQSSMRLHKTATPTILVQLQ